MCARVGGLVLRARPETLNPKPCEPLPVGVDRVRLRCAGVPLGVGVQRQHRRVEHRARHLVVRGMRRSRPGGAHFGGRARPGFGAARPVVRGGTADARARAHTCRHSLCAGPWVWVRPRGGEVRYMYPNISIYICVCVCVLHACTYIIHFSVHVRIGRGYVCAHQCAMVMDRLCAHALAGSGCGLGLKPETLNRASLCPSAWTTCGFGAQAFNSASAFNANIGAWNTASVSNMAYVCAARGPAARSMADELGRALNAARPVVRGGTADARARRAHVSALACAGPWV